LSGVNLALALLALQQIPPGAQGAQGDSLRQGLDTLAGHAGSIRDTLTPPPLPGGIAAMVRFIFRVPQWIQIGGIVVGLVVAAVVIRLLWRHRLAIIAWFKATSPGLRGAMAAGGVVVLFLMAFAGTKSWNYMQHDNGFCTGCHIMEQPFGRFETRAGKHRDRKCHDCHQQSLYASARQLVLWVANRPDKITPHAPVPNSRCEGCHQLPNGKKPWEHALYLAGHKAHFESDSSALKDLKCVTCHGKEIHKFIPSARTCQQEGCHVNQSVRMQKMIDLPEINCVTCHDFTADLPALADRDSAVRALVPSAGQCRSCHQMQTKPAGYDLTKDPHKGSCGSCHDVHADSIPVQARTRCTDCHTDLSRSAFHNGANHQRVKQDCLLCHNPHAASLDPSDCAGCHAKVRTRGKFHPPLPFDTAAAARGHIGLAVPPADLPVPARYLEHGPVANPVIEERLDDHRGKGDALPAELPAARDSPAGAAPMAQDSFPHNRHTSLPCLTCHNVNRADHGLVFEVPRGCDLCHHQRFRAGTATASECATCHQPDELAAPKSETVAVKVGVHAPVARPVAFQHARHRELACTSCHVPPALMPPDSVRTCQACHARRHERARD
jgi:hypothetical protein